MLAFRDFALRRGERPLLSGINLVLHAGCKVGVTGRNGCGKSSLLAAVRGELEADAGALAVPSGVRMASVAQETPALPDAAIEYVLGGDVEVAAAITEAGAAESRDEHARAASAHQRIEALDGYSARARAGRLLHGLGFRTDDHERPVAEFSGGWRVRLNVARALMAPSDLLLLDEPTNHLDLDAVLWLEQWLRRYPGTLLVVSHDREFLDAVTSHVLHLEAGGATLYRGNYSAFERQRAEQLHQQQAAHTKEQAERAHLEAFINRFRAKATKARQAQSRMRRLEKLAGTEAVRVARPLHLDFPTPARLPQSMLKLECVEAGYEAHAGAAQAANAGVEPTAVAACAAPSGQMQREVVVSGVTLTIEAGDRIGLLGPNGAGKSTLVKTLVGVLPVLSGERTAHRDLGIGYFAQHTMESLDAGSSPLEHMVHHAPAAAPQERRDWLGRWGFTGDRVMDPVDGFSGGERARLALALLAWHKPGLLILDEPTNHLDMDMREALADALNDYPGALLLVSHDRHLLGLACDEFWRVADGSVTHFDGDLDDYARWLRQLRQPDADKATRTGAPKLDARERRRASAAERERTRGQRKRLNALEVDVADVEHRLGELTEQLADPKVYTGPTAALVELGRKQGELHRRKQQLEDEWLALSEALESPTA